MPRTSRNTPVRILLVEDSEEDADLMILALKDGTLTLEICHVEDGQEAIDFLRQEGRHTASLRPHLILLDLHLPRKNGHEVLQEIKTDGNLGRIPVVVLTSSDNERAFIEAYDLHANCCVSKPMDQEQYALTIKQIERFWLTLPKL
jgi:CheY-like chemotaxis protein